MGRGREEFVGSGARDGGGVPRPVAIPIWKCALERIGFTTPLKKAYSLFLENLEEFILEITFINNLK